MTKEAVEILRARQRALDARPIKKVAEAKARKKMKAMQKLQKAMKKAEGVNESADLSEREKAQQIQKLMLKGLSKAKQKKSEVKVVVAKGAHKGVKGRPKGVKGRYQMVDARMRKEVRLMTWLAILSCPYCNSIGSCEEKEGKSEQVASVTNLFLFYCIQYRFQGFTSCRA